MKMDRYDVVLDIVEHPEKFTAERVAEILSDSESREIYNVLCKTEAAMRLGKGIDVEAEWKVFSDGISGRSRRYFPWFGSRAASISAITCLSVAVAAAGIALTMAVGGDKVAGGEVEAAEAAVPSGATSCIATVQTDTVGDNPAPVLFEDESLAEIMKTVATVYGVEVRFDNDESASLHFYYRLDPTLPLDEIVSQLDTFEQVSIRRDGSTIVIY